MEIKNLIFLLFLFPLFSWGIQYQPTSSVKRHEISLNFDLRLSKEKNLWKKFSSKSLTWTVLIPEFNDFIPSPYKNIFTPGVDLGFLFFDEKNKNTDVCPVDKEGYQGAWHLGVLGKIDYFEPVKFFGSLGLTRGNCVKKKDLFDVSLKQELSHYLSYGMFFSLKLLDKSSVYALDQDYGVNDSRNKT